MHAYTTHKYDTNLIVGIVHHIVAFPGAYINSPDKICSCPYDNTKRDQCTVLLYKEGTLEKWQAKTLLPWNSNIPNNHGPANE